MQESHFDEIRPFLTGETLDTSLSFPITHVDVKTPTDRVTFLGSLLENKTVLHIGCADHLGVIDAKIAAGEHLHSALIETSKNVTGIDLNVEAIEHLQGKYDIPDLHICILQYCLIAHFLKNEPPSGLSVIVITLAPSLNNQSL